MHPNSLRNWEKYGLIKPVRLPGGQRRYSLEELNHLLQSSQISAEPETAVLYARVSSVKQVGSGNLERQKNRREEYCVQKGYEVIAAIAEQGSGLNEKRRGLGRVLKMAREGKDQLARFGFSYLERYLNDFGARVEVVNREEPKSPRKSWFRICWPFSPAFPPSFTGATARSFAKG